MCVDNLILVPYKVFGIVYAINRKVWASNGTTDVSDKGQQIAAFLSRGTSKARSCIAALVARTGFVRTNHNTPVEPHKSTAKNSTIEVSVLIIVAIVSGMKLYCEVRSFNNNPTFKPINIRYCKLHRINNVSMAALNQ